MTNAVHKTVSIDVRYFDKLVQMNFMAVCGTVNRDQWVFG